MKKKVNKLKRHLKFWLKYLKKEGSLPSFIVVGTVKGGTTSLYSYLAQHKSVRPAFTKELFYFYDTDKGSLNRGLRWYKSNFATEKDLKNRNQITGEASAPYFYYPKAALEMKKTIPDAKFVVLLRNPINKLFSHYQMMIHGGYTKKSFEEIVDPIFVDGIESKKTPWINQSNYVPQIKHWLEVFPDRNQTLFIKSEDFFENPQKVFNKVCGFLNIENQKIDVTPKNQGGYKEKIKPETKEKLKEVFKEHNKEVVEILGEEFHW